jgi:hypothetical protein
MRRLLLSVMALCSLSVMVGCQAHCTRGICDCAYDDYCSSRTPWIRHSHAEVAVPNGVPIDPVNVVPTTLPKAMPPVAPAPKMPPVAPAGARELPPIVTPAKGLE